MAGNRIPNLTTATFDRAIGAAEIPVLVDFHATWCGPCRALGPVLDQLAGEFDGRIGFGKVDIDQEPELASRFQVQSVPDLKLFVGGQEVYDIPGFVPAPALRTFLARVAEAAESRATHEAQQR